MNEALASAEAKAEVEFTGVPRVITGPEAVEGKPYKRTEAVLADGTRLVTFSENAGKKLQGQLDKETVFKVQKADQDGWAHKILAMPGIWTPSDSSGGQGGGGGRQWVDNSPSIEAQKSVDLGLQATALFGLQKGDTEDVLMQRIARFATDMHGLIQELKGQAPAQPTQSDTPMTTEQVAEAFGAEVVDDQSELTNLWAEAIEKKGGGTRAGVLLKLAEKYNKGFRVEDVGAADLKGLLES